jgi:hypothetical protein
MPTFYDQSKPHQYADSKDMLTLQHAVSVQNCSSHNSKEVRIYNF